MSAVCAKHKGVFDIPGGLIFGVPQIMTPLVAGVTKLHLCPNCTGLLMEWLNAPTRVGKPSAPRPEDAVQEHMAFITYTKDQQRMTCGTCGLFVTMAKDTPPDAARQRLQELHAK